MTKILLSGVPGTGKSTVAAHIESQYGFYHVDMEQDDFAPRHQLESDRDGFIAKLAMHENVLLSWGFGPFTDKASIDYLQSHDFHVIWMDGNRVASFREFMKRENNDPVMEAMYYGQMQMIVVTGIVQQLKPTQINPFTEAGNFRPVDEIAREVISSADNGVSFPA